MKFPDLKGELITYISQIIILHLLQAIRAMCFASLVGKG